MKKAHLALAILAIGLTACAGQVGPTGPMGPTGQQGQEGSTGTALIQEYVGTIPASGSYTVNVPEITGRNSSTYVQVYWAFSTSPDIWTPMTDGWLDSSASRVCGISWTSGKVVFYEMQANDLYMIKVFQHN